MQRKRERESTIDFMKHTREIGSKNSNGGLSAAARPQGLSDVVAVFQLDGIAGTSASVNAATKLH
jgi:hypothetical protein